MSLSKPRDTVMRGRDILFVPLAAGAVIYAGALVAVNASGYGAPGSVSATLRAAGRAEDTVDNSTGANGAAGVTVRRGVFRFKNYASDAITQADLLADCYIYDDETVARTNGAGARSKAGKILDLDATGVFVEIA